MRLVWVIGALAVGVLVFAAIEIGSQRFGVLSALTQHLWLDGVVYAVASLFAAGICLPAFRRARGVVAPLAALLYVILLPLLAGILAWIVEVAGRGFAGGLNDLLGNLAVKLVNTMATFGLELWFVALPTAFVGALVLWGIARAGRPPGRR